jgi:group I intron endonuclease
MNQGIYKIVNKQNDNFYIGSAVNLTRRKSRHFSELRNQKHNNKRLQNAWNLYGEEIFEFIIVELVESREDLYVAEDKWLSDHVGKQYCYNLGMAAISPMLGLCGPLSPTYGYKHTQEAKAKISEAGKGRVISAETRAKRSVKLKGRIISQKQREQISATLSGEGNFWYGKKRPDHGAKVSKPIEVYKDGVLQKTFDSIQALRIELDLKPTTVNRALKSGNPISKGKMAGYSFKYYNTSPL